MSEIRNSFRERRLPQGVALVMLCALLVCSQIAALAHAELDCEHEDCSLCVGPASNDALVGESELTAKPPGEQRVESPIPTSIRLACPTRAQLIRGPPTT